ncbi:MAG: hypothetical protein FWD78_00145 [Treponema sp.]|nr:hypothetical protein [Treponema sp.]
MLKQLLLITLILNISIGGIFAQNNTKKADYGAAMGIGPEWNMDSRYNFAMGGVFGLDINLPNSLAFGLTITGSTNFNGIKVVEPAGLFRWYFMGNGHTGFFAQADLGAFVIFENGNITPMYLGGIRGGYRFSLSQVFYAEPYGRIGYPFAFGIGAMAGFKF